MSVCNLIQDGREKILMLKLVLSRGRHKAVQSLLYRLAIICIPLVQMRYALVE